jgi:ribonuclease BN (tRNA processing enzyme)
MRLRFLGSGDAFGSGGRFNTCFLVDRSQENILIDCGASAMVAMRQFGVDPNRIATIVLSHLHGDHFGGLPFFILDAQLVSRRVRPLLIAGPVGLSSRLEALMEAMFPGSFGAERRFRIELVELQPEIPTRLGASGPEVTAFVVSHPSGAPSLALRLACDGRILAYTGDTEWVDTLLRASSGADLLIAEAYQFERKVRFHLDFATLRDRLPEIGAKRLIVTHMSADMLTRLRDLVGAEAAHDGLEVEIT